MAVYQVTSVIRRHAATYIRFADGVEVEIRSAMTEAALLSSLLPHDRGLACLALMPRILAGTALLSPITVTVDFMAAVPIEVSR